MHVTCATLVSTTLKYTTSDHIIEVNLKVHVVLRCVCHTYCKLWEVLHTTSTTSMHPHMAVGVFCQRQSQVHVLRCACRRYCKLWEALRTDYEIEKRFEAINRKVRQGGSRRCSSSSRNRSAVQHRTAHVQITTASQRLPTVLFLLLLLLLPHDRACQVPAVYAC